MTEDYVITNLTVHVVDKMDDEKVHYIEFQFIDKKPNFDKVKEFITNFLKSDGGYLIDYEYDYREITEHDLIDDKTITKH